MFSNRIPCMLLTLHLLRSLAARLPRRNRASDTSPGYALSSYILRHAAATSFRCGPSSSFEDAHGVRKGAHTQTMTNFEDVHLFRATGTPSSSGRSRLERPAAANAATTSS